MASPRARSARARAQRPQLVPRDTRKATPPVADDDAVEIARRGRGDTEWQSPRPEDMLGVAVDQDVNVDQPFSPPVPVPTPRAIPLPTPATTPGTGLSLRTITEGDFDRLWDWARDDAAGVHAFLSTTPAHSRELYDYFQQALAEQQAGTAFLRSIDMHAAQGAAHVGFVLLRPITRTSQVSIGMTYVYLTPPLQPAMAQLLPRILDVVAQLEPTLTLTLITDDYAFAERLRPHGLQLQIALTRPPVPARK